jgi:hypothetical protein
MAMRKVRHQLYRALDAHKSQLEITRGVAAGPDLEALDRRIEAVQQLLEWISRAHRAALNLAREDRRGQS